MRRAVRAFLGERTLCSDFQLRDGLFPEPVLRLFDQGLALKIPRNVFSAWMVARLPGAAGSRPVDQLVTCRCSRTRWPYSLTCSGSGPMKSAADGQMPGIRSLLLGRVSLRTP